MEAEIPGLKILRNAFINKCTQKGPCILADPTKGNMPCLSCSLKEIDKDEWMHNEHYCIGNICSKENILREGCTNGLARRTQHYGYIYNYKKVNNPLTETKLLSSNIVIELFAEMLAPNFPDKRVPKQCIVNEYVTGQNISPHTDNPVFGPIVMTVSLIGSCIMEMSHERKGKRNFELNAGDIVLLSEDARDIWKHSILKLEDERRVSLTFRTVD